MTRDATKLEPPLGVRVPAELLEQLDAEGERLRALHPGLEVSRSDVVRTLLVEALAARRKK